MSERVNAYDCQKCGGVTWTRDADVGVTPFMFDCKATPGCQGPAYSRFYRVPDDHPAPTWEWYRLSDAAARRKERMWPGSLDHHKGGGLWPRSIPSTPSDSAVPEPSETP